jgi:hypothetical protein
LYLPDKKKSDYCRPWLDDDQGEATIRLTLQKPPRKRVLLPHLGSIHGVTPVAGSENPELNAGRDSGHHVGAHGGERRLSIAERVEAHRAAPVGGGPLPVIAGGGVQREAPERRRRALEDVARQLEQALGGAEAGDGRRPQVAEAAVPELRDLVVRASSSSSGFPTITYFLYHAKPSSICTGTTVFLVDVHIR